MTENCATKTPAFYAGTTTMWTDASRDRYGRPTRELYATHRGQWGTVAVVVTMPKSYVDGGHGKRYMVSDWRMELRGTRPEPRDFDTLAGAKAYAESLVRPLNLAEILTLDAYAKAVAGADANKLETWAQHHRDGIRANWDTDRDAADIHEVMRRIVVAELNRRTR